MKRITTLLALVLALMTAPMAMAADISAETVSGASTVDSAQAKQLFDDGAAFIDTRRDSDWDAGRIPDAFHLELKSNFTEASLSAEVGKNDPLVCYCNGHSCRRAEACAEKAVSWGFSKVYYYRDGFPAWKSAGYPVE